MAPADAVRPASREPDDGRAEARRWVRQKRIFYTVVGIYLVLSVMWFTIHLLDDSSGFWSYWPMLGTGVGVVVTGVILFGVGGLFGVDWEWRQMEKYMQRFTDTHEAEPTHGPDGAGVPRSTMLI